MMFSHLHQKHLLEGKQVQSYTLLLKINKCQTILDIFLMDSQVSPSLLSLKIIFYIMKFDMEIRLIKLMLELSFML